MARGLRQQRERYLLRAQGHDSRRKLWGSKGIVLPLLGFLWTGRVTSQQTELSLRVLSIARFGEVSYRRGAPLPNPQELTARVEALPSNLGFRGAAGDDSRVAHYGDQFVLPPLLEQAERTFRSPKRLSFQDIRKLQQT